MVTLSLTLGDGINKRVMFCATSAFLLSWRRHRRGGGGAAPFLPFSSSPQPGPRGRILSLTLFFFLLQRPITPRWMVHNSSQVNTRTNTLSQRTFAYQIEVGWRVCVGVASSFKRIVQVVSRATLGKRGRGFSSPARALLNCLVLLAYMWWKRLLCLLQPVITEQ